MSPASAAAGPVALSVLVAAAGLVVGRLLQVRLCAGGYRLDDEVGPPPAAPPALLPVVTAGVWGLLAWRIGPAGEWTVLPAYLGLSVAGIALAWVDADVHRLPRGLTAPAAVALVAQLVVASLATGQWAALGRAALCGVATWGAFLGLALLAASLRSGFGNGDVRLAGLLGAATGYVSAWGPVVATYAAFLLAGGWAVVRILAGTATSRSRIAFGPWLLIGALVAVLLGPAGDA